MIKKLKRISLLAVLIPITMFLAGSLYLTYAQWQTYTTTNRAVDTLDQVHALEQLSTTYYDELNCLAQASGLHEEIDKRCHKAREAVDQTVLHIMDHTREEPLFRTYAHVLLPEKNTLLKKALPNPKLMIALLKNIRYDLDSSRHLDVATLIHGNYALRMIDPIYQSMTHYGLEASELNTKNNLLLIQSLTRMMRATQRERILIAYQIASRSPLSQAQLKDLDTFISHASVQLDNLPGLPESVHRLFSGKDYETLLDQIEEAQINLISNYKTGDYDLGLEQWDTLIHDKIHRLSQAMESLYTDSRHTLTAALTHEEQTMMIGFVFTLLSLIFFIYMLIYYTKVRGEDVALENVVSQVEAFSHLKSGDKQILPAIPKNLNNKKEVYHYLESILHLLHQKEIEAEEANKAKSLFLANMSHEIRTPLNGIVGFTQLLQNSIRNPQEQEYISIIMESSEHLLNIINDILDLTKISAEKMTLETTSFDLIKKVETTVDILRVKFEQKEISLSVYTDPGIDRNRLGDPTKLSQVLTNLIGNAIKFTPEYGIIDLLIYPGNDPETIFFSVKDSGIGINEDQQKKIFEAFAQADLSTTREYGGTGLGLAISSKIVTQMGGELLLESEIGHGSTFSFAVPLPIDRVSPQKSYPTFTPRTIGLALPDASIYRDVDHYLGEYIAYFGSQIQVYTYDNLFDTKLSITWPEMMLFDHTLYRAQDDLDKIASLPCPTVLITNGNLRIRIDPERHIFYRVIEAPITLSKVISILSQPSADQPKQPALEESMNAMPYFGPLKILVAEDNPINQKLIRATLEKFGLHITLANNGKEALQARKESQYDLVMMDIQMPVMNGVAATQKILEYEQFNSLKHIPIIALTANALSGDREKYLKEGMDGYLSKPIHIKELQATIASFFPEIPAPIDATSVKTHKAHVKNTEQPTGHPEAVTTQPEEETPLTSPKTPQTSAPKNPTIQQESRILLYIKSDEHRARYQAKFEQLGYHVTPAVQIKDVVFKLNGDTPYQYTVCEVASLAGYAKQICQFIEHHDSHPVMLTPSDRLDAYPYCSSLANIHTGIDRIADLLK